MVTIDKKKLSSKIFTKEYLIKIEVLLSYKSKSSANCIDFYKKSVAFISHQSTIKIRSIVTGITENILHHQDQKFLCTKFSPDGTYVAAGSECGTLTVWKRETGHHIISLKGHTAGATDIKISADGLLLASTAQWDKSIKIWNIQTGHCIATFKDSFLIQSIEFTNNDTCIISRSVNDVYKTWNISTGALINILPKKYKDLTRRFYCLSPDKNLVLFSSRKNQYRTFTVWDVFQNKAVAQLESPSHGTFSFSANNQYIIGKFVNEISLWDTTTGKLLHTTISSVTTLSFVLFTDNHTILEVSDTAIVVRDQSLQTINSFATQRQSMATVVYAYIFNNVVAYLTKQNCLTVVDINTQKIIFKEEIDYSLIPFALSSKSEMIAVIKYDNSIYLHKKNEVKPLFMLKGHTQGVTSVIFNKKDTLLLSTSHDATLKLWNTSTGKCLMTFEGHTQRVNHALFTSDDKIISCSNDNSIKLWDVETGECIETLQGHTDWVRSVSVSSDGKTLLSASYDTTLKLWDIKTGHLLTTISTTQRVIRAQFHPYKQEFLSLGEDKITTLWDAQTGQKKISMVHPDFYFPESSENLIGYAFSTYSPDGKYIMTFFDEQYKYGTWGAALIIRDSNSGKKIKTMGDRSDNDQIPCFNNKSSLIIHILKHTYKNKLQIRKWNI